MPCPYCQHETIHHSDSLIRHTLRVFVDSSKRYCPNCKKKWKVKARKTTTMGSGVLVFIFLVIAVLTLKTVFSGELFNTGGLSRPSSKPKGIAGMFSLSSSGGSAGGQSIEDLKKRFGKS